MGDTASFSSGCGSDNAMNNSGTTVLSVTGPESDAVTLGTDSRCCTTIVHGAALASRIALATLAAVSYMLKYVKRKKGSQMVADML